MHIWRARLVAGLIALSTSLATAGSGISMSIYSSKMMESSSVFGHAFLCFSVATGAGPKEDCYGFYPKTKENKTWTIGGTDMVNEFNRVPIRFPSISETVTIEITNDQRKRILSEMHSWKASGFNLASRNCIDFVDRALMLAGKKRPPRYATQTPTQYVFAFSKLIKPTPTPPVPPAPQPPSKFCEDPMVLASKAFHMRAGNGGVADVFESRMTDQTPIIVYPKHGGQNQKWEFQGLPDGTTLIRSVLSGRYMTVRGDRIVQLSRVAGDRSQEWCIENASSRVVSGLSTTNEKRYLSTNGNAQQLLITTSPIAWSFE